MIGKRAAIPEGFEILVPELAVWQPVDEGEPRVAADLVEELAAGFAAAGVDQKEAPVAVQGERNNERGHGAGFIHVA